MKQIKAILPAPTHGNWVGDGFPMRRVFGERGFTHEVSPFLMLAYGGPMVFPPTGQRRGVGPHPHRGFETVTMSFQGEIEHVDSAGNRDVIAPGDVQWMTAASGLIHEEMHSTAFARQGGTLEMIQLWVNLPGKFKMTAPRYQAIVSKNIPIVELPQDSGAVRVVAGDFDGIRGAAATYSPINLWDIRLRAGKRTELLVPEGDTTIVFVRQGQIRAGENTLGEADGALFAAGGTRIVLEASTDADILLLSGEPIDEPIVAHGPFVMNAEHEIHQAMTDYHSGRMGRMTG
ncbi:MAG: pirin family protein [Pseudomonadota bacterium]